MVMFLEVPIIRIYKTAINTNSFGSLVESRWAKRGTLPLLKREMLCLLMSGPCMFQLERLSAKCTLKAMTSNRETSLFIISGP
jgi:hypothetical protein